MTSALNQSNSPTTAVTQMISGINHEESLEFSNVFIGIIVCNFLFLRHDLQAKQVCGQCSIISSRCPIIGVINHFLHQRHRHS